MMYWHNENSVEKILDCLSEGGIGKVERCASRFDLDVLDRGVNPVYGSEDYAYKIGENQLGREELQREIRTWKEAPGELRQFLADIDDYGEDGSWIKMERASRVGDRSVNGKVHKGLEERDWVCHDLHINNTGMVNGDPVAIDYSSGCNKREN